MSEQTIESTPQPGGEVEEARVKAEVKEDARLKKERAANDKATQSVRDSAWEKALAALGAQEDEEPTPEPTEEPAAEAASEPAPEEAPAEETPTEEPAETKADEPDRSKLRERYAQLTVEEQRVRRDRAALKAERDQLQAERDAAQKELDAIRAIREGNAVEGLSALGIDYSTLTAAVLKSGGTQADAERLKKEIAGPLEEKMKALEEREQRVLQMQQEATIAQAKQSINATIATGKDERWELLSQVPNATDEVWSLMQIRWERSGKQAAPSIEECADAIEALLVEEATRYTSAKKIQARLGGSAQATEPARQASERAKPAETPPKPKTLTNGAAGTVSRRVESIDPEDCRRRALAAMEQLE